MRALIQQFAAARQHHIRAATLEEYIRLLRPLNKYEAASLTRRQIASIIEALPRGTGRNTLAALSTLFKWAIQTGRLEHDPTWGLKRPRAHQRDRVLSLDELQAIWAATGDGSDHSRITRLLLLSGCRRDEWGNAQWTEVGADRLVLPGNRTKNHKQHPVPLPDLALQQLPKKRKAWPYLFGRRRYSGFSGWSKAKEELDQRCGVTDWCHHDLRRSCATHWSELGLADRDLIELMLNHTSGSRGGVCGIYLRSTRWAARVQLAMAWTGLIAPPLPTPNVVDRPSRDTIELGVVLGG